MVIPTNDLICTDDFCDNYGSPADPEVCTGEHFRPGNGPFRDGHVWVLISKCTTCIYRPGNLMLLSPGDRESMEQTCRQNQAPIPCHQTLNGPRSVCRGFYDLHRQDIVPLVLAEAMGLIEFDEPPTKE